LLGFGWQLLALHNLQIIVVDGPITVFIFVALRQEVAWLVC
jgi:hypothetical protein